MLQRIGLAEPGIHHAVGEDDIGRGPARKHAGRRERRIVPQAVDEDRVIVRRMGFQPGDKLWRIAPMSQRPEPRTTPAGRVHRHRIVFQIGGVRRVEGHDLPHALISGRLVLAKDAFDGPAPPGIDGCDDMEQLHHAVTTSRRRFSMALAFR